MIKIDYLMPILVTYESNEYICLVDYPKNNVYFLSSLDQDTKKKIYNLILKKVNDDSMYDYKAPEIIQNPRISQIISDVNNDSIRKKFNNPPSQVTEDKINE